MYTVSCSFLQYNISSHLSRTSLSRPSLSLYTQSSSLLPYNFSSRSSCTWSGRLRPHRYRCPRCGSPFSHTTSRHAGRARRPCAHRYQLYTTSRALLRFYFFRFTRRRTYSNSIVLHAVYLLFSYSLSSGSLRTSSRLLCVRLYRCTRCRASCSHNISSRARRERRHGSHRYLCIRRQAHFSQYPE